MITKKDVKDLKEGSIIYEATTQESFNTEICCYEVVSSKEAKLRYEMNIAKPYMSKKEILFTMKNSNRFKYFKTVKQAFKFIEGHK